MNKRIVKLILGSLVLLASTLPISAENSRAKYIGGGALLLGLIAYVIYTHEITPTKAWEFSKKTAKNSCHNFAAWLQGMIKSTSKNFSSDSKTSPVKHQAQRIECFSCMEELEPKEFVVIECPQLGEEIHQMCEKCAKNWFSKKNKDNCPVCFQQVANEFLTTMRSQNSEHPSHVGKDSADNGPLVESEDRTCKLCCEEYNINNPKVILECAGTHDAQGNWIHGDEFHICCEECILNMENNQQSQPLQCPYCRGQIYKYSIIVE